MKLLYLLLPILILLILFLNFSKSGFGNDNSIPEVYIFVASWCGYCKRSKDTFEKLANNYNHVKIYDVDDPKSAELMEKYGVQSFPTIIKSDGTEFKGERTYDVLEKFVSV